MSHILKSIIPVFNFHFESENLGKERGGIQKFEDIENENNFLDEINRIFSQFFKSFLSVKYNKIADTTFKKSCLETQAVMFRNPLDRDPSLLDYIAGTPHISNKYIFILLPPTKAYEFL